MRGSIVFLSPLETTPKVWYVELAPHVVLHLGSRQAV